MNGQNQWGLRFTPMVIDPSQTSLPNKSKQKQIHQPEKLLNLCFPASSSLWSQNLLFALPVIVQMDTRTTTDKLKISICLLRKLPALRVHQIISATVTEGDETSGNLLEAFFAYCVLIEQRGCSLCFLLPQKQGECPCPWARITRLS